MLKYDPRGLSLTQRTIPNSFLCAGTSEKGTSTGTITFPSSISHLLLSQRPQQILQTQKQVVASYTPLVRGIVNLQGKATEQKKEAKNWGK